MNRLKSIIRNEGQLVLRNKLFYIPLLVNFVIWGYCIIAYEIQAIHYEERASVFYESFIWILLLNLLIVGLIAVYMASKDPENEFEQLVVTYDVKNVEWILGKWVITQLYGLCITFITTIVQSVWFFNAAMSTGDWFTHIFYVFIQMEGAFFLLISIGFLCAVVIKSMLAYFVVPAILVLSLLLPFDYARQAYIWDNPKFHLLTPFDFMFVETREGDFITLYFDQAVHPGEQFDVNLNYEGNILQYRDDAYMEQAFIKKNRIYLPKEAGWYPLIGKRPLMIAREREHFYTKWNGGLRSSK